MTLTPTFSSSSSLKSPITPTASFQWCLSDLACSRAKSGTRSSQEQSSLQCTENIPFLSTCISCTSSCSSRLALQKTLLFLWFIWAARNGHLVAVLWLVLAGGWPAGGWVPSAFCWASSLTFLASEMGTEKGKHSSLIISIHWLQFFDLLLLQLI